MRKALSIKALLQVEISLSKCFYILLFYLKYPDLSAHRKRDLKHGAGFSVIRADRSLVQVDDLPGQGKADTGFPVFSHVEAVKDMGQIFRGNAIPIVLYPYRRIPLLRAAGQAQLAAGIAHTVG